MQFKILLAIVFLASSTQPSTATISSVYRWISSFFVAEQEAQIGGQTSDFTRRIGEFEDWNSTYGGQNTTYVYVEVNHDNPSNLTFDNATTAEHSINSYDDGQNASYFIESSLHVSSASNSEEFDDNLENSTGVTEEIWRARSHENVPDFEETVAEHGELTVNTSENSEGSENVSSSEFLDGNDTAFSNQTAMNFSELASPLDNSSSVSVEEESEVESTAEQDKWEEYFEELMVHDKMFCFSRFVCEVSANPDDFLEYGRRVENFFNTYSPAVGSAAYWFKAAANLGKGSSSDPEKCLRSYPSCPMTIEQIRNEVIRHR